MKKRTQDEHGPRHVTPVGRSVFHDLGFDEAEARVLEMRADLMVALREKIQKKGWWPATIRPAGPAGLRARR